MSNKNCVNHNSPTFFINGKTKKKCYSKNRKNNNNNNNNNNNRNNNNNNRNNNNNSNNSNNSSNRSNNNNNNLNNSNTNGIINIAHTPNNNGIFNISDAPNIKKNAYNQSSKSNRDYSFSAIESPVHNSIFLNKLGNLKKKNPQFNTPNNRTNNRRANNGRTNNGRANNDRANTIRANNGRTNNGRANNGRANTIRANNSRANTIRANNGRANNSNNNNNGRATTRLANNSNNNNNGRETTRLANNAINNFEQNSLHEFINENKKDFRKQLNKLVNSVQKIEKTKQMIIDDLAKYKRASNTKIAKLEKIVIKFYNFLTDVISIMEMEDGDKVRHMEDIIEKMKSNKQFMEDVAHIIQFDEENNNEENTNQKVPNTIDVITSNNRKSQYTSESVKKHLENNSFNLTKVIKEIDELI